MKDTRVEKICVKCSCAFLVPRYKILLGRGRFCSRECFINYHSEEVACRICGITFREEKKRIIDGRGKFCSLLCKYKFGHTLDARKKMSVAKIGRPVPGRQGKGCHFWRGGVTPKNKKIRLGMRARIWRKSIFERDKYTCQICGKVGGRLQADHIKSFSMFPKLRFEITNGRTLCVPCHGKTDNYGRKALKICY